MVEASLLAELYLTLWHEGSTGNRLQPQETAAWTGFT